MFEPPTSRAVTVTVAVPPDTGVTRTVVPDTDTDTVATDASDDDAPYVSASPSGSRNAIDTSTVCAPSSTRRDSGGSWPTASGDWFATVTGNVCVADVFEPSASVADTVTVAVPPDTGVTVTVAPDVETVATDGSDDDAPYVRSSSSSSRNAAETSTVRAPSGTRSRSGGRLPTGSGERLAATVTANVWVADVFEPPASVAVTVTTAVPAACGVSVTVEPDTDTVITDSFDDDASYVSTSRSGSRKAPDTSTGNGSSVALSALLPSVPTASGPAFSGTVT